MIVPGYWMYEASGVLRPVVEKYVEGRWLDPDEIAVMRRYLRVRERRAVYRCRVLPCRARYSQCPSLSPRL